MDEVVTLPSGFVKLEVLCVYGGLMMECWHNKGGERSVWKVW